MSRAFKSLYTDVVEYQNQDKLDIFLKSRSLCIVLIEVNLDWKIEDQSRFNSLWEILHANFENIWKQTLSKFLVRHFQAIIIFLIFLCTYIINIASHKLMCCKVFPEKISEYYVCGRSKGESPLSDQMIIANF